MEYLLLLNRVHSLMMQDRVQAAGERMAELVAASLHGTMAPYVREGSRERTMMVIKIRQYND